MTSVSGLAPQRMACIAAVIIAAASSHLAAAETVPKNFVVHETPKPVAAISFEGTQQ
jgi:hypothetical protein